MTNDEVNSTIQPALASQSRIGLMMILHGFLFVDWTTYLHLYGMTYPTHTMAWILCFLWFDCVDALWRTCNDIFHRQQNEHSNLEDLQLQERLHWFLDNRASLAHRNQFLLHFSHQDIPHLPHRTKKELHACLHRQKTYTPKNYYYLKRSIMNH
jgi:hypothetical protein